MTSRTLPFRPRDMLLVSVILLLTLSTVMVFSAGAFYRSMEDSFFFLRRQLLWLPIAGLIGVLFAGLDYRSYRAWYVPIYLVALALLGLVLVPGVGASVNNSQRWLRVGGLQFQPSELAKLAVVLLVAGFLSNRPERVRSLVRGFLPLGSLIILMFGLILIEPDLGGSAFVLALGTGLMLIGGMRIRYMITSSLAVAPILYFYAVEHWDTIWVRLQGLLNPTEVYQVKHSLIAFGSGGLTGVGLGASVEKLRFLPEAHTDFILAVIGEELGLVGSLGVLGLFSVLVLAGAAIALEARDRFGFLLASGITMALGFQAAVNVAVVTGTAPTKGMPLPFLTFGGSGLCMTLAEVGILVSVATYGRKDGAPPVVAAGAGSPEATEAADPAR